MTIECCACANELDDGRAEAIRMGWVEARSVWTCSECADEYAEEQQAEYDARWPALRELV